MDQAAKGAAALTAKDFSSAVTHYTDAIAINSQAVDYYIKRSTAYTRISPPDHAAALRDAEIALTLASNRGKREFIIQAQLRRAIALFSLERYGDAKACFDWVKEMDKDDKSLKIWSMKLDTKMEALDSDHETMKVGVKRLPDVQVPAPKPQKGDASPKPVEPIQAPPVTDGTPTKVEAVQTPANKIRHEWYQTAETVVVSLFAKGIPKDKATIDIQSSSLAISFPLVSGADYDFSLDPLYGAIDPAASSAKFMTTKVDITMKKSRVGEMWPTLESNGSGITVKDEETGDGDEEAKRTAPANKPTNSAPAYPTSSKSGPKNWDKVADDLTKRPKKDGKEGEKGNDDGLDDFEGGDPVNGFFKQIYSSADADTRRAMMKSYQESNGTALSTNWAEVGKGKVETQPPDGMEAKPW
ncbi:MAG: hypothetical protein Q9183_000559 [Haloplaca sp. 2 TL-2023]